MQCHLSKTSLIKIWNSSKSRYKKIKKQGKYFYLVLNDLSKIIVFGQNAVVSFDPSN